MTLTWKGLDIFAVGEESGSEFPMGELIGKVTAEAMNIFGRQITRERIFSAGQRLTLSKQDLWEICFFFSVFVIPSSIESFVGFLKANDVLINVE